METTLEPPRREGEENLFDLLLTANELTCASDGAFDIAVGALIKAWGFYRREGRVPTTPERREAMGNAGSRHLLLDAETNAVYLMCFWYDDEFSRTSDGWRFRSRSQIRCLDKLI